MSSPYKITSIYVLVGGLWILLSDQLLGFLVRDPALLTRIASYKGLLFIAVTAIMLQLLIQHSEKELRSNREFLSRILESTGEAILLLDRDARFSFANAAAVRILGRPREEIVGKSNEDLNLLSLEGTPLQADEFPCAVLKKGGKPEGNSDFPPRLPPVSICSPVALAFRRTAP